MMYLSTAKKNSKVLDKRSLRIFSQVLAGHIVCGFFSQVLAGHIVQRDVTSWVGTFTHTPNRYTVTTGILICSPCRITYVPEVSRDL